jgi:hypothetical protein
MFIVIVRDPAPPAEPLPPLDDPLEPRALFEAPKITFGATSP